MPNPLWSTPGDGGPSVQTVASAAALIPAQAHTRAPGSALFGSDSPICYEWHEPSFQTYTTATGDVSGTSRSFFTPILGGASNPRLVYANFLSGDTIPGTLATWTLAASIEYNGVIFACTFNGQTTVTVPPGGIVVTDPLSIVFAGTATDIVWVRSYVAAAVVGTNLLINHVNAATTFSLYGNRASGDQGYQNFKQFNGAGNGSNQTLTTGTAWGNPFSAAFGPIGVIGKLGKPTPVVAITGDSIASGSSDYGGLPGATGIPFGATYGWPTRYATGDNAGTGFPIVRLGRNGEALADFVAQTAATNSVYRGTYFDLATTVIDQYGTNDLYLEGATLAQLIAIKLAYWNQLKTVRGKTQVFACTLLPRTNSSDSTWSVASQTFVSAPAEAIRKQFNTYMRAPISAGPGKSALYDAAAQGTPLDGVLDCAAPVEVASTGVLKPNGGYWYYNGIAGNSGNGVFLAVTADGVHPTGAGCELILAALPSIRSIVSLGVAL